MAVDLQGNIIDTYGTKTGGQVNVQTGQLVAPPSVPTAITSESLKPVTPISIPQKPQDTMNYAGMVAGGTSMLNSYTTPSGVKVDANGNIVAPAPDTSANPDTPAPTWYQKLLDQLKPPAPVNTSDMYNADYTASGIDAKQTQANIDAKAYKDSQAKLQGINAKLAGLSAEGQAQNISLENQGGAITSRGVGIASTANNREIAIRSLPLQAEALAAQAEIASAQGNAQLSQSILQQAQDHLDKVFQIHQVDATNQYNYQKDLYTSALAVADKAETRALEAKKTEEANNFQLMRDNINNAQALAKTAMDNDQADIASKITQLDPKSSTYSQDIAKLQGQIKTGNTVDDQYKKMQIAKMRQEINAASNSGASHVAIVNDAGNTVSIPIDVAPYYNVASNGVEYIDASTLQGTAKDKTNIINQANKAGYKVITNKNTAADLVNIKDANAKLDTVSSIMSGIAQPGWLARALGGAGMTKLAQMAESDPQKAASGTLESIGLDILKAISGVQGFRGNQTAIQQVTEHLPKVTDTTDTIGKKIEYIKALIADREDAAVGKPKSTSVSTDQTVNGVTYTKGADGLYYPKK